METASLPPLLFMFVLALAAGWAIGAKTLENRAFAQHEPLLAGITVVGAILAANQTGYNLLSKWLALAAIVLAAIAVSAAYSLAARPVSKPGAKPRKHHP